MIDAMKRRDFIQTINSESERMTTLVNENLDLILVQRLGDLVSDLYLAEGTKRVRLWKRTADALTKLKVPATREGLPVELVRAEIARGRAVLPSNHRHPESEPNRRLDSSRARVRPVARGHRDRAAGRDVSRAGRGGGAWAWSSRLS